MTEYVFRLGMAPILIASQKRFREALLLTRPHGQRSDVGLANALFEVSLASFTNEDALKSREAQYDAANAQARYTLPLNTSFLHVTHVGVSEMREFQPVLR